MLNNINFFQTWFCVWYVFFFKKFKNRIPLLNCDLNLLPHALGRSSPNSMKSLCSGFRDPWQWHTVQHESLAVSRNTQRPKTEVQLFLWFLGTDHWAYCFFKYTCCIHSAYGNLKRYLNLQVLCFLVHEWDCKHLNFSLKPMFVCTL